MHSFFCIKRACSTKKTARPSQIILARHTSLQRQSFFCIKRACSMKKTARPSQLLLTLQRSWPPYSLWQTIMVFAMAPLYHHGIRLQHSNLLILLAHFTPITRDKFLCWDPVNWSDKRLIQGTRV